MRCRYGPLFEGQELGVSLDPVAGFFRVRGVGILAFQKSIRIDRRLCGYLWIHIFEIDGCQFNFSGPPGGRRATLACRCCRCVPLKLAAGAA